MYAFKQSACRSLKTTDANLFCAIFSFTNKASYSSSLSNLRSSILTYPFSERDISISGVHDRPLLMKKRRGFAPVLSVDAAPGGEDMRQVVMFIKFCDCVQKFDNIQ